MFKRRLAVLGAVGVLVLTGLGGSAMADESPSAIPGVKVTCTTSDGKVVEFAERGRALPDPDAKPGEKMREGIMITRTDDGGVAIKKLPEGEIPDGVPAMPATKAEGLTAADGEPVADAVQLEKGTVQKAEAGGAPTEFAKTTAIKCESK